MLTKWLDDGFNRFMVVAAIVVAITIVGAYVLTPTAEEMARTLESMEYEQVRVGELRMASCGRDATGRDFTGIQNGKKVAGVVCCNAATCYVRIELRR